MQAVAGLTYELDAGRTLAIIGESGSGKTVSSRAIMGLLPDYAQVTGSARLERHASCIGLNDGEMRRHRGADVAMVFQDPARSLNPTMRVGTQITEAVTRTRTSTRRPHGSGRSSCWGSSGCRRPSSASASIRISCRAACASGS